MKLDDVWELEKSIKDERILKLRSKENLDIKAFFKKPRSKHPVHKSIFFVNELTCYHLGICLNFPINRVLMASFQDEIGLFSYFFEDNLLQFYDSVYKHSSNPNYNFDGCFYIIKSHEVQHIMRLDALKELFVFDQWVYALDRRPNNVMVERCKNNNSRLWAVDHEHSLNNGPDETHPSYRLEDVEAKVLRGICHPTQMTYGIRNLAEIDNAMRRIESFSDDEIDRVVNSITDQVLNKYKVDSESEYSVQSNSKIIEKILKGRKERLRKLIDDCWLDWRTEVNSDIL